jgi:hypothetical protein
VYGGVHLIRVREAFPIRPAVAGRSGYHRGSLAETAMMRLKTIFSGKLKAREWSRQETELRVRCAAMNRMASLGMPRSYAI